MSQNSLASGLTDQASLRPSDATRRTTAVAKNSPSFKPVQLDMLGIPSSDNFPATRYQGSKLKLLGWLSEIFRNIEFDSALDLFSGTSSVSYLLKVLGRRVTANDKLAFNATVAAALIANDSTQLFATDAERLFEYAPNRAYDNFVSRTFDGIFYPATENAEIDLVVQNIHSDLVGASKSVALFALFQACLAKRPYNLFHRANLYMRTSEVERTFGNKTTWERPLREHFMSAVQEANKAVFSNGLRHCSLNVDFRDVPGEFDLVYMDPPYFNSRGVGVDYLDFYHFLEGLTDYSRWAERLTLKYKHRPFERDSENPWGNARTALNAFSLAFDRFRQSTLVISYRTCGVPSVEEITDALKAQGRPTPTVHLREHKYALSKAKSSEVVIVSRR